MPDLMISLTMPIPGDPIVSVPALTFSRWLPLGADDAIRVAASASRKNSLMHDGVGSV
jgi:hypothetical protein